MAIREIISAMSVKAKIIAVSTAVVVVGVVGTIIGISLSKEDEYRVIKVFEMTGEAIVEREGTGELSAYVGMNLENGDKLTVGENGTLRIVMDNDKYVLLDSGTVLKLNATGSSSDSKTKIELMRGEILNEITKPLSENSSYEVATPKATMAVRGTSFVVKVDEDGENGYITKQQTLQGKVEVELLSPDGKRTGKKVVIEADKSVTIQTIPNEESGENAEIDGTSFFVIENENGDFQIVSDPEDAVSEIDYETISDNIKRIAIYSDDTRMMVLDEVVAVKIRENLGVAPKETTATDTTTTPEITTITTTTPETTTIPDVTTTPEVTTVPIETTVPEVVTVAEGTTLPEETTVPTETTIPEETTTPKTTTAPAVTTEATTTPEEEVTEYIVEFVYNSSVVKTMKVEEGETISLSDAPSASALDLDTETTYVVWYIDGEEFTSSYTVVDDTTVTASTGRYNNITFEDLDGEVITTYKTKWGQSLNDAGITPPAIPDVPDGYIAKYMYNSEVINLDMDLSGDYTFRASLFVTVTFVDADDNEIASYEVKESKLLSSVLSTVPTVPDRDGYSAVGWTDNGVSVLNGDALLNTQCSSSMTFRPKYDKLYNIRYSVNGNYLFSNNANFLDVQRTYNAYIGTVTITRQDASPLTDETVIYKINGVTIDPNTTFVSDALTMIGQNADYTGEIQVDITVLSDPITISFYSDDFVTIYKTYIIERGGTLPEIPAQPDPEASGFSWVNPDGASAHLTLDTTFDEDASFRPLYY